MPTKYEHRLKKTGVACAAVLFLGTAMSALATPAAAAPGNNGTVKVAPHGDVDAIPNNHPHVGCVFQLEWFGFDADVTSTVLFEEQAPTTGVGMSVAGDTTVQLDNDPGNGAGNGGFDGTEAYTLSFTGAPHPQQGYHVKLTINTPESNGATVKHKVFWVEGCAPTTTTETPSPTPTPTPSPTPNPIPNPIPNPEVNPGQETAEEPEAEVLDTQASNNNSNGGNDSAAQQELPSAVNAGASGTVDEAASSTSSARSMLALLMVLLGAGFGALALSRRARG